MNCSPTETMTVTGVITRDEVKWIAIGEEGWSELAPGAGNVLEIRAPALGSEDADTGIGAVLVTGNDTGGDTTGTILMGRDPEAAHTELSNRMNRRGHRLHLCGSDPCAYNGEMDLIHVTSARTFPLDSFEAPYMKSWGKKMITDFSKALAEGLDPFRSLKRTKKPSPGEDSEEKKSEKKGPKKPGEGALRKARALAKAEGRRKRVRREESKKSKEARKGEKPKEDSRQDALRKKLAQFRERAAGRARDLKDSEKEGKKKKGKKVKDVESVEDEDSEDASTEEDSSCVLEEPDETKLGSGTKLSSPLALTDRPHQELEAEMNRLMKKRRQTMSSKPEAQLLAIAAQQRSRAEVMSELKDKRKSGRSKEKEDDRHGKRRKKKEKKRKKKEKKKKKKKKKDGGSSGGSSSSSSRSGSRGTNKSGSSTSSSSDSDLLAPLQRKSKQNPGGVLKMLLRHARLLMDQDTAVDVAEEDGIAGGVRMTSYFSLMLRPYHSTASRDMKELYLLATTIDQLRQGKLGALGDALASRFIAIQTAMSEGSWRAAQYLEMHPLDSGTPAPMPLLLQARKHAKLVDKSQQLEDPRGGKGSWKNQERNRWNPDEWNKGKGKKGKKGKGRGRGQWSQYHDGWDYNNHQGNWWNKQREDRSKEDKGGGDKKNAEKEKT